jgi:hypothetical protein
MMPDEATTQEGVQPECPPPEQSEAEDLDKAVNVRYLVPGAYTLVRGAQDSLRMTVNEDRSYLSVFPRRCFPYTYRSRYISLRDAAGEEIGIIRDLKEAPKEWRGWLEDALNMRYFVPIVKSIRSVKQRYGGMEWSVETDRGPRRMVTKHIRDTIVEIDVGRYIMNDVDGNRYELNVRYMDEPAKRIMERLL